jgi:Protein of unknown function (DUF1761)
MRINYPAVAVSAVAYWVLGALWYSPLLFERTFVALKGYTPEQVEAIRASSHAAEIGAAFAVSLVTAYVLAHFVKFTGAETARTGMLTAFWLWLGFVLTTNLSTVLFEARPAGLYLINNGYHLLGMLGMGAMLAVWRRRDARVPAYQT